MDIPVKRSYDGGSTYFPMCVLDSVFLNNDISVKNTLGSIRKGSTILKNTSLQTLIDKLLAIEGTDLEVELDKKVDKQDGKCLSDENFTTEFKNKLNAAITEHQDISHKVDKEEGKGLSTNDFTDEWREILGKAITEHQDISHKVDKEEGKGLSQENFTTELKNKLKSLSPTIAYDDTELRNLISGKLSTVDIQTSISDSSIYPVQSKVLSVKLNQLDETDAALQTKSDSHDSKLASHTTTLSSHTNKLNTQNTKITNLTNENTQRKSEISQLNSDLTEYTIENTSTRSNGCLALFAMLDEKSSHKFSSKVITQVSLLSHTTAVVSGKYKLVIWLNNGGEHNNDNNKVICGSTNSISYTYNTTKYNTWTFNNVKIPSDGRIIFSVVPDNDDYTDDKIKSMTWDDKPTKYFPISYEIVSDSNSEIQSKSSGTISRALANVVVSVKENKFDFINEQIGDISSDTTLYHTNEGTNPNVFSNTIKWIQLDKEFSNKCSQDIRMVSIQSINALSITGNHRLLLFSNSGEFNPDDTNTKLIGISEDSHQIIGIGGRIWNKWYFNKVNLPRNSKLIIIATNGDTNTIDTIKHWNFSSAVTNSTTIGNQFVFNNDIPSDFKYGGIDESGNSFIISNYRANVKISCKNSSYFEDKLSNASEIISPAETVTSNNIKNYYSFAQWIQLDKSHFKHCGIKSLSLRSAKDATPNNYKLVLFKSSSDTPSNDTTTFAAVSNNAVILKGSYQYNTWTFDNAYIPQNYHLIALLVYDIVPDSDIVNCTWNEIKTKMQGAFSISFQDGSKNTDIICSGGTNYPNLLINSKFAYDDSISFIKNNLANLMIEAVESMSTSQKTKFKAALGL